MSRGQQVVHKKPRDQSSDSEYSSSNEARSRRSASSSRSSDASNQRDSQSRSGQYSSMDKMRMSLSRSPSPVRRRPSTSVSRGSYTSKKLSNKERLSQQSQMHGKKAYKRKMVSMEGETAVQAKRQKSKELKPGHIKNGGKPRKRYKPGEGALREIRKYQMSTELLLRK